MLVAPKSLFRGRRSRCDRLDRLVGVVGFSLKAALPFGSSVRTDVAATAQLVGLESAAVDLLIGGGSTDFECVDKLIDGKGLLVHVRPFLEALGVR